VVAASEVAAAGEVGDVEVLAGDVFAATAEVFGAAGELCAEHNPAGRVARRAIAKIELIDFIETEPFF
jgi:hypothetical protein